MDRRLDIENKEKKYLDEKELFILYWLLHKGHISTLWSNIFTPNGKDEVFSKEDVGDISTLEERINESYQNSLKRTKSKMQSPTILSYLLRLGKELDEEKFSVICNADYALVDGGFLHSDMQNTMIEYMNDTKSARAKFEEYKVLNKEQKDFLDKVIEGKDFDSKKFSKIAQRPVDEYQEAILNKKSEPGFIELVNKLITPYDGGRWDKNDAEKFLEIYYRHNKEEFRKNVMTEKTFLHEDWQTKLANLIFEHVEVVLVIKNSQKIIKYLTQYIAHFSQDELDGLSKSGLSGSLFSEGLTSVPLYTQFFGFKKQKDILIKHIEEKYAEYQRNDLEISHPYFEPEYIGNDKEGTVKISIVEKNKIKDLFLFVHTMIALEYEGSFQIEDFYYGTNTLFDPYDRGYVFKIRLKKNNDKKSSNRESQLKALEALIEKDKKEDELAERIFRKIDEKKQKDKKDLPPELYLNALGDLWREPKPKYCYQMGEKSDRHQIIRYLANNKGYKQTSAISAALRGKSEQSIRTEIAKIRGNIKKFLNIEGKQVIEEGRKGSGYTIGSKYKIKIIS